MLDFPRLMTYNLIMGVVTKISLCHHSHYLNNTMKNPCLSIGNPSFLRRRNYQQSMISNQLFIEIIQLYLGLAE